MFITAVISDEKNQKAYNLDTLGRGPLGDATYQISRTQYKKILGDAKNQIH